MLIGGFAVSARAKPRATIDIDFLINAKRGTYEKNLTKIIETKGYKTVTCTGDLLDPLNGLIRVYDDNGQEIVDLIPSMWKWQCEAIAFAEEIEIASGVKLPVAKIDDARNETYIITPR